MNINNDEKNRTKKAKKYQNKKDKKENDATIKTGLISRRKIYQKRYFFVRIIFLTQ